MSFHPEQEKIYYCDTLSEIASIILAMADLIEEQQQKQNCQNATKIAKLKSKLIDLSDMYNKENDFEITLDDINNDKVYDAWEIVQTYMNWK